MDERKRGAKVRKGERRAVLSDGIPSCVIAVTIINGRLSATIAITLAAIYSNTRASKNALGLNV